MPRTVLKARDYKLNEFSAWLKSQLALKGLNQNDAAAWLYMSQQGFNYKLKNNSFTLEELMTIFHRLGTTKGEVGELMIY